MDQIVWEKGVREKFEGIISKVPPFMRSIAAKKVTQKLEIILKQANRLDVSEKDMVDAFFAETPFGFHGPMKTDMEELKIDYTKYGYKK